MPRRFLVTGGAGYVGSHLVAALLARGVAVVVLDNLRTGHRAAVLPGARLEVADLADRAAVDAVLADGPWDAVFHFASLSLVGESMRLPFRYLTENGMNGIRLIEACVRHGVGRFVLSSTANLFGTPEEMPDPRDGADRSRLALWREQVDDRARPAVGRTGAWTALGLPALFQRGRRRSRRPAGRGPRPRNPPDPAGDRCRAGAGA